MIPEVVLDADEVDVHQRDKLVHYVAVRGDTELIAYLARLDGDYFYEPFLLLSKNYLFIYF